LGFPSTCQEVRRERRSTKWVSIDLQNKIIQITDDLNGMG
jgi:hypothetical protein